MKKRETALVPTSDHAKRLAAIMHRQKTTSWNEKKEISPFRKLAKNIQEEDLALVERYYRMNWPPRTNHNHLRHDLATLINNWAGEVDRARAWGEAHPLKQPPRKIIQMPVQPEQAMTPEERLQAETEFERLCGRKPNWGDYDTRN